MNVLNEILAIIEEYRGLPADYVDIEDLMHKRKLLATFGSNLSVEVGEKRAAWRRAEYRAEVNKVQKEISFYNKHGNLGRAKIMAKANTGDLFEAAVEAENEFFKLDYIFRNLREVLGELNQRISYLREEQKQDRFFNS